jgi:hypothetical protein
MTKIAEDLKMPEDLDEDGRQAWEIIVNNALEYNLTYTGGCRAFYSPKEWAARKESYGADSKLIVVYDGGEIRELFDPYSLSFKPFLDFKDKFAKAGFFAEPATCWYSCVYKL